MVSKSEQDHLQNLTEYTNVKDEDTNSDIKETKCGSSPLGIIKDMTILKIENSLKLFTKEDGHFYHVHKILGFACLLHYSYRAYICYKTGSMHFDDSYWTLGAIMLHWMLNATSFIFRISSYRLKLAPMIYPEARWHSLIFSSRSLFTMTIMWISRRHEIVFLLYFRPVTVLLTMFLADFVTKSFKDQGTSMRAMPMPKYITHYWRHKLNQFYAISQILATCQMIFGYCIDGVFVVLFPIQISMFLMTLVRKSIISSGSWHFYYALSLLSVFVWNIHARIYNPMPWKGGFVLASTVIVTFFRFWVPSVSKYVVWSFVGILNLYCMVVLKTYIEVVP